MNSRVGENVIIISGAAPRKCMLCGKCSASCVSYDKMEYHPHEFVYMVETGDMERLLASESIYKCVSCMACVEKCPRGVAPGKIIEAVRAVAQRRKDGSRMTPDDVPEITDDDTPQQAVMCALRKYRR